jgi:RNase P subunit RPR2
MLGVLTSIFRIASRSWLNNISTPLSHKVNTSMVAKAKQMKTALNRNVKNTLCSDCDCDIVLPSAEQFGEYSLLLRQGIMATFFAGK